MAVNVKMKTFGLTLIAWATAVSASYEGNLNYRSPSVADDHQGLGIDLSIVEARMIQTRDAEYDVKDLNFTHGVASVCIVRPT